MQKTNERKKCSMERKKTRDDHYNDNTAVTNKQFATLFWPLQWHPVFYYTQNLMKNKKNSLPRHNIVYHDDHTNILQKKLWQCSKKQKPQSSKKKGEPKKQPSERLDITQKQPNVHLGIMTTIGLESQNI
jgi:hypothetical protein